MALRKRGNHYWHAYFDAWKREGTTLMKQRVEICLYTHDFDIARKLESDLMRKNKEASLEARAGAKIEALLNGSTVNVQHARRQKRRLKLEDALKRAERYRVIGATAEKHWKRFVREINAVYMDEVTPEAALAYLEKIAPDGSKSFNNARCALNGIFKLLQVDAGIESSPFELIRSRRVSSIAQRPITEDEYRRILDVAPEPWNSAVKIAWHTGMREKDVFTLRWCEIHGDLIRKLPAKTARFRREVLIPIHPALQAVLDKLPHKGERVLGAWPYKPRCSSFETAFGKILDASGVERDADSKVCFNSLRNSFISRCDAAGIPRHAIRGIVGHVSDQITDLYSHDETSARLIQKLPD